MSPRATGTILQSSFHFFLLFFLWTSFSCDLFFSFLFLLLFPVTESLGSSCRLGQLEQFFKAHFTFTENETISLPLAKPSIILLKLEHYYLNFCYIRKSNIRLKKKQTNKNSPLSASTLFVKTDHISL